MYQGEMRRMKQGAGPSAWSVDRHARTAALLSLAWIVLFYLFHRSPSIDIAFSSMFCISDGPDGSVCSVFPAREHWLTGTFRPIFYWAPIAALVIMAVDLALQYARHGWTNSDRMRGEILAIAAYLIGPILIVNGWLKAYSGRPRPIDVSIFGGDLHFVPVGDFGGACARSFPQSWSPTDPCRPRRLISGHGDEPRRRLTNG